MTRIITALVILALLASAGGWYWHRNSAVAVTFRTSEVKRGDMVPTISATGTVEPRAVVDVGAQVAGLILAFGTDANGKPIDYRSPVTQGMVLARIDDTTYAAAAANADAALAAANAGVVRAVADLGQMNAKLDQAASDWDRAQKLGKGDALSESDYNTYQAAFKTAKANVGVGEAAIEQAKAAVKQSEANVKTAQQNLRYCTITSPVDGVILDRRVNVGQTVVSSLNAPSLFLIAKDLRQIQVWVSVNEADIGSIAEAQPVTFSVDTFPGQIFQGQVGKVRLNATMTQNVVTYTVEVDTDNADSRLLPYLSANVKFEVSHDKDVLLVSNAALRWTPDDDMLTPEDRAAEAARKQQRRGQRPAEGEAGGAAGATIGPTSRSTTGSAGRGGRSRGGSGQHGHGTIWIRDGKVVKPIHVKTGASDGVSTVISGDDVKEGMQVVDGVVRTQVDNSGGTTNPFATPMFRGGNRPPGTGGGGGGGGGGR